MGLVVLAPVGLKEPCLVFCGDDSSLVQHGDSLRWRCLGQPGAWCSGPLSLPRLALTPVRVAKLLW